MKKILVGSLLVTSFMFGANEKAENCNNFLEKADEALAMSKEINYLSSAAKIQIKSGYALEATAYMQRYEICQKNVAYLQINDEGTTVNGRK